MPCGNGNYSKVSGLEKCTTCPIGYYCPNTLPLRDPVVCDNTKYCPVGSAVGKPCPAGTYSPPGVVGLE